MTSTSVASRTRVDERPLDLGSGGVAAGVRDAVAVVAALAGQGQLAVERAVEARPHLHELAHRGRTLAHQRPHRRLVAHAGPGDDRVAEVVVGGVPGAEGGGDATLRPAGRPGGEDVLGHQQHAQRRLPADVQGGGEAGDAGPDDGDVGLDVPARLGRGQPARQRSLTHSSIPTLSIRRVAPTRAATSNRAAPCSGISPRSAARSSR